VPSQIIDDPLYTRSIDLFRVNWKRLDAALITLEPALLGSPELFPLIPGTKLRRLKLVGFPGVPPLSIFFTIDGERIILKVAELIDIEP
jgi:hypothetical protein